MEKFAEQVRNISAGRHTVMPVFGDAESLATAAVAVKALGAGKLHVVHIDHGMLRLGEKEAIIDSLKNMGITNIIELPIEKFITVYTARADDGKVLGPVSTVYDPFEKRKLVSAAIQKEYNRFITKAFPEACSLGVHSIGGMCLEIGDRAAEIAADAGACEWLVRQPFPLAGLAIRILCNDCAIALTTEQRELLCNTVSAIGGSEFSAKLVPFRSVGVRDAVRSYKSMAVVVHKGADSDFIKAKGIAEAVDNKLSYVSRVLVRIDGEQKPETYHGRPMFVTDKTLDVVRNADAVVAREFAATKAMQFFAVLLPFVEDREKKYSVAIRAVSTADFKTAAALIPGEDFDKDILRRIAELVKKEESSIDMVFYDITPKPPAAIEFE